MDLLLHSRNFKSHTLGRTLTLALAVSATVALSGCNTSEALSPSETLNQGYLVDEETLQQVPVGSSREQVLLALGTPSTTATFDNEVFYYISQKRVRNVAFMNPRIVDQRILAVYFGDDGRVANIAHYGLQDGKVFDFISRTTPTGGQDRSFIGQLLSGAGGMPANPFGGGGGPQY
ncbi:outer membrane protein assembly factor BamE [Aquamicrobium sp. LC103]|uniref:outer membrane protein assembly factor BamE n=1 Tax=Aquamicrobium sp. LC103 TaxID=1120658 RepID=UPI00063E9A7C|nr:outer membrane protein assembly factor BamE [Aquamicrobium sp. LC103]TKT81429.1 outer membrane protein assembly factor BamE [Aquamicrobium sp. LC103]